MAAVELATAYVSLVPTLKGVQGKLSEEFGGAGVSAGKIFGGSFAGTFAGSLAADAFRAVGATVGKLIGTGFAESKEAETANAQLAAGIASTGNAANVSVGELNKLASSIQAYSGQTDDSIAATQGLLLRFTNIKNVGADKIFDDATRAAADMAARLGGDASDQAQKLGRALNDPVAGVTALARAGVTFTDQQKEQIKAMTEAGDLLGAQKLILAQVNTAYGGSAEAFGGTFEGALARVKRGFEDFSQGTVQGVLPLFTPVLNGIANALGGLAPVAERVGGVLSSGLSQAVAFLGPAFAQIGTAIGPLIGPIIQLWTSFSPLSIILKAIAPLLPTLAGAFGDLVSMVGGALAPALQTLLPVFQNLSSILVGVLGRALATVLPIITQVIGILGPVLSSVLTQVIPIIGTVANLLGPVLTTVFDSLFPVIESVVGIVGSLLEAVLPLLTPILGLIAPLAELVSAVLPPLVALFGALLPPLVGLLKPIIDLISPLIGFLVPILQVVVEVLSAIVSGVVAAVTWFVNLVTGSKEAGSQLDSVWSGVVDFFGGIWDNIIGFFQDGIANVVGFFTSLPQTILGALGNLGKVLYNAGKDLINGLLEGAGSLLRNVGKFFLDLLPSWIVEPFRLALGIRSPSVVMRGLGKQIPAGLIQGITDGQAAVERTMSDLMGLSPVSALRTSVGRTSGVDYGPALAADRPIMMDGSVVGWVRELANGEATLVVNDYDHDRSRITRGGKLRR